VKKKAVTFLRFDKTGGEENSTTILVKLEVIHLSVMLGYHCLQTKLINCLQNNSFSSFMSS
jgi:hypothetical protein